MRQRTTELEAANESLRGEIADRRRAEEKLRQSERDYRALFANAHDAILVFDPDDETILEVNDRACEVYGFQRAEMIGASLDIIQPKDRRGHARTREILERDTYQGFELVHYRKDQTELFVEVNAALVQYQGRPAILSINRDVTDCKPAERTLRESEQRFRQIAENVGEVFFLSDARDNRAIYLSPAYEEIWGRPVEEVYADPRAWQEAVHPEDRQRVSAVLQKHGRGRESFSNEYRIVRPDGAIRWVHDRVFPVRNEAGEAYRIVGVSEDITDRKRVEAALRDSERQSREQLAELEVLYRTAPLGLCHMDTGLRYLRCNEKLAEINGIPANDHIGRTLREIVPEIADTMEPVYRKVIQSGEPVVDVVATGATAADPKTKRHFSACYYPVKSEDGVVQGVSSIVQEITQRKREEEDRRRLQDELAHLGRVGTLGEMAATLAHELNQPLAAIGNYADGSLHILQSAEADSQDVRESLEHIGRLTRQAGTIIQRIRDVVRKDEPRRSSVPPNDLVREVVELVEFEAQAKAVKIELDLADELPLVLVDRIQIQQVILNLVRNAFDAMGEIDQRTAKLAIHTRSAPVGTVEVTVSDTGKGLPEGAAEKCFEPFFTTKSDGLGLGLGISRSIIEAHGGRLWTEPQTVGATFRFTLPAVPVEPDGEA